MKDKNDWKQSQLSATWPLLSPAVTSTFAFPARGTGYYCHLAADPTIEHRTDSGRNSSLQTRSQLQVFLKPTLTAKIELNFSWALLSPRQVKLFPPREHLDFYHNSELSSKLQSHYSRVCLNPYIYLFMAPKFQIWAFLWFVSTDFKSYSSRLTIKSPLMKEKTRIN